jgi:hypothetical protein
MAKQWRVAWIYLVAAGFSLSAALTYTAIHGIRWSLVLPGVVIAVSGYEFQAAIRLTRRLAPDRLRSWMAALANLLFAIGGACVLIGLWALVHRAGAIE